MPSVKNIGKPCAGSGVGRAFAKQKLAKLHARFDEGGQVRACFLLYPLVQCVNIAVAQVLKQLDGKLIDGGFGESVRHWL